ncbi:hypothetical protein EA002_11500 [Vibrio anguillarum]|nr:hypothetical protein [Vibrio anguillarum]
MLISTAYSNKAKCIPFFIRTKTALKVDYVMLSIKAKHFIFNHVYIADKFKNAINFINNILLVWGFVSITYYTISKTISNLVKARRLNSK